MKNSNKKFKVEDSLVFKDMAVEEPLYFFDEEESKLTDFEGLVHGLGFMDAVAVLRTLEVFEGINEHTVSELSYWDRYDNVLSLIQENNRYRTNH
ncbi:MAG: hypothetical protein FWF23_01350 [Alphaproteobacteria bacterium]|nr:hypothetical protein [Alphaproteobacteria bacterium]MCL2505132.1 hypothetical protein [Alphaproteobacteria bacterium]